VSDPALVWLVVGLITTAVALAFAIALVRNVMVLGRALSRFRDEVEPLARAIGEQGARASARGSSLGDHVPGARPRGQR
jgi:hypothetical protein